MYQAFALHTIRIWQTTKKKKQTKLTKSFLFSGLVLHLTAWNVSKYGVISGPYFALFSPNAGKYGPEIIPYLEKGFKLAVLQYLVLQYVEEVFPKMCSSLS